MAFRATVALVVALAGCGMPAGEEARPDSGPAYPNAEVIRSTASSEADPYCDDEGCCPVWLTGYGTRDDVEDVVGFYEQRGFRQRGLAGEIDARVVRWVGIRDGDRSSWRRADVFVGSVGGVEGWPAVVEISSPNCG